MTTYTKFQLLNYFFNYKTDDFRCSENDPIFQLYPDISGLRTFI